MADKKKYYWLRFQRDFFRSLRIKRLRKLAGGDTFTIIYLKMQLLSIATEGHLEYKGVFDSFVEEIAEDIEEEPENVNVTVQFLLSCGLLEQNGNDYFLPYAAENIGCETADAARMRESRKKAQLEQSSNNVRTMFNPCYAEKEIEKEKDKEIEKEVKHKHGEYQNVLLTDKELEKLKTEFPKDWQERIDNLSAYMKSKGASYKDHLATIRNWARRDKKKQETSKFNQIEKNDYDFDVLAEILEKNNV